MQQHTPSMDSDIAIAIQSSGDPGRLRAYTCGGLNQRSHKVEVVMTVPLTGDVTALAMMPHGVAWCDVSGRVHLHRQDLLEVNQGDEVSAPGTSFWCGSVVHALRWDAADHMVTADAHGRLLNWQLDALRSEPADRPLLIASSTGAWLEILRVDDNQVIAIAADGHLDWLDSQGQVTRTAFLPLPSRNLSSVSICSTAHLLVYGVAPPCDESVSVRQRLTDLNHGWLAWDLKRGQPYPLPDVIRYADSLTTTHDAVLAMNIQGMSWRWVAGDAAPTPLTGWPAGPCQLVRVIDLQPTVMRLGAGGELDILQLESNVWHPIPSPIPIAAAKRFWVGELGVFAIERQGRRGTHVRQLQGQVLKAHAHDDARKRDDLLEQLENTDDDDIRAQALRAKIADDEGDRLKALMHCRQVIASSNGSTPAAWSAFYGRLLWQTAALDELTNSHEHTEGLTGSLLPECVNQLFTQQIYPLIDAWDPRPPEDCMWSTLAWARVKRWGTAGPFWLGAERERPVHLRDENRNLLHEALAACGASSKDLAVLSPRGELLKTSGWVFAESIPGTDLQRQLVIWTRPGKGINLETRWAVRANQPASGSAWAAGWEAVQDPNWRSACRRHMDIAQEAVACQVMPDASLVQPSPVNGHPAAAEFGDVLATTSQEAMP